MEKCVPNKSTTCVVSGVFAVVEVVEGGTGNEEEESGRSPRKLIAAVILGAEQHFPGLPEKQHEAVGPLPKQQEGEGRRKLNLCSSTITPMM